MKRFFIYLFIAMTLISCNSKKEISLVRYYSQTGNTEAVAMQIQSLTNADIEAIDIEDPYDGTYAETIARVQKERTEDVLPSLKTLKSMIEDYDIIYLGYPVWFGTFAPPIIQLLKEQNFAGKKIVPFCTFGSGGLEATVNELRALLPQSTVADGYGVRAARTKAIPAEVERFLKENKYIAGNVEPWGEYSADELVTEVEAKIFDDACGDYQFPLGTPISFGKRTTGFGTDYRFNVKSAAPDGSESHSVIYVIVKEGAKPEFKLVVR